MVVVGMVVVHSPSSLVLTFVRSCSRQIWQPPDGASVCVISPTGGVRPLRCGCVGSLHDGGLNGHHGPVTKTTLVVWRSLGVSSLHVGGCEGVESVGGGEFLSGTYVCLWWSCGCEALRAAFVVLVEV
jgi:hypothetical protein